MLRIEVKEATLAQRFVRLKNLEALGLVPDLLRELLHERGRVRADGVRGGGKVAGGLRRACVRIQLFRVREGGHLQRINGGGGRLLGAAGLFGCRLRLAKGLRAEAIVILHEHNAIALVGALFGGKR